MYTLIIQIISKLLGHLQKEIRDKNLRPVKSIDLNLKWQIWTPDDENNPVIIKQRKLFNKYVINIDNMLYLIGIIDPQ